MLEKISSFISDALYSYILIIVLVLGGLYFTFRTKFVQIRLLGEQLRAVTEKPKDGKGVSSFQALMVSTASRVGTGNIIGVSTAICLGGYGSVFWMWVIAIVGSISLNREKQREDSYKMSLLFFCLKLKHRLISNTLSYHSVSYLFEACNISACNKVALHTVLLSSIPRIFINISHNLMKLSIYFFSGPAVAH